MGELGSRALLLAGTRQASCSLAAALAPAAHVTRRVSACGEFSYQDYGFWDGHAFVFFCRLNDVSYIECGRPRRHDRSARRLILLAMLLAACRRRTTRSRPRTKEAVAS